MFLYTTIKGGKLPLLMVVCLSFCIIFFSELCIEHIHGITLLLFNFVLSLTTSHATNASNGNAAMRALMFGIVLVG